MYIYISHIRTYTSVHWLEYLISYKVYIQASTVVALNLKSIMEPKDCGYLEYFIVMLAEARIASPTAQAYFKHFLNIPLAKADYKAICKVKNW